MTRRPRRPSGGRLVLATDPRGAKGGRRARRRGGRASRSRPGAQGGCSSPSSGRRRRGPTMLASAAARELEERAAPDGFERVAARGRVCWLALPPATSRLDELGAGPRRAWPRRPSPWPSSRPALAGGAGRAGSKPRRRAPARRSAGRRSLAASAVIELRERGFRAECLARRSGAWPPRAARSPALEAGGAASPHAARLARGWTPGPDCARRASASAADGRARPGARAADRRGVRAPLLRGVLARSAARYRAARAQRAADLAALSGARSLRDDFPRLFAPARLPSGAPIRTPGQGRLSRPGGAAAREAATRNGVDPVALRVSFPDRRFVRARAGEGVASRRRSIAGRCRAPADPGSGSRQSGEAEASPPAAASTAPTMASGGGYSGPLAYRQGKPMRPDVATAFDRMAAAAQADGICARHQLGVPVRRRAGAAVGRAPGSALGRAAGPVAPPLRHGARPRPAIRVLVAGGARGRVRLPPALQLGAVALRLYARPGAVLQRRERRRMPAGGGEPDAGRRASRRSFPLASATDPARRGALERLRRAARRPADGGVQLQPLRGLSGRGAGDRPVHAGDRARLRPSRPVRRAGGDRRPGAPDVGSPRASSAARSRSPSPPTTPARARSTPATACRTSRRPRPTSRASSA